MLGGGGAGRKLCIDGESSVNIDVLSVVRWTAGESQAQGANLQ